MKIEKDLHSIRYDLATLVESEDLTADELVSLSHISKATLYQIANKEDVAPSVYEKFYSFLYDYGKHFNVIKSEMLEEDYPFLCFHGSKKGLSEVTVDGSRELCDFGKGFYLTNSYQTAVDFVADYSDSKVYAFYLDDRDLKIVRFDINLEWVLAICYFRGTLKKYSDAKVIKDIVKKVNEADVVIAPIADNTMFTIMNYFINGWVNSSVAQKALASANLGNQVVIKSQKALEHLHYEHQFYLSNAERKDIVTKLEERNSSLLKQFKKIEREKLEGLYIEDIFHA